MAPTISGNFSTASEVPEKAVVGEVQTPSHRSTPPSTCLLDLPARSAQHSVSAVIVAPKLASLAKMETRQIRIE